MSNSNCQTIRSQIEELPLGDDYGHSIQLHLNQCDACRGFEKEQRSLRELVGSLGTVQAPADFDFKLRARMAARPASRGTSLRWALNPLFAIATAILLFVGVVGTVSFINKRPNNEPTVAFTPSPAAVQGNQATPQPTVISAPPEKPNGAVATQNERPTKRNNGPSSQLAYKPKRTISSSEFSSMGAQGFGSTPTQFNSSRVFSIDASLNSMKVSLDDGRGNARTISLPGVSFGSQRVLATGGQLQQKGVW